MGLYATTDALGEVSFLLPADGGNSTNYNGYKFRADYAGTQTYSDPLLVTADVNNPVGIAVGGSALSPSHRVPASPRLGGEEIQVASLYFLPGLLAQFSNSAIADSNGEHLYFYHSDHLGTPLFLTDTDGVVVWRGEYLPFGEVFTEDTDPDGDGVEVEQPFRFPGQYEDAETGLYYNYFRDYDPALGRYVEADPIGLGGGDINLMSYVRQNPVYWVDDYGLEVVKCARAADLAWPASEFDHHWLKTDTYESGMGIAGGIIPGEGAESGGLLIETETVDHTGQCEKEGSRPIPIDFPVDEGCINKLIAPGQPLGLWMIPPTNQCQSWTSGVLESCRTDFEPYYWLYGVKP